MSIVGYERLITTMTIAFLYLGAGDVTTRWPETFRERSHQYVDFARIDSVIVAYTSSVFAHGTSAVSFVQVQISLLRQNHQNIYSSHPE